MRSPASIVLLLSAGVASASDVVSPGLALTTYVRSLVTKAIVASKPPPTGPAPVDRLLELARPTDRGLDANETIRARIDNIIRSCELRYDGPADIAEDSRLYSPCDLIYTSQVSSEKANAAGGKFRGRFGRKNFRTETLRQDIVRDGDTVTAVNHLGFRLFGKVPGDVVLAGPAVREDAPGAKRSETAKSHLSVRASFGQPRVRFGPLNLRVGPESSVYLDTTFVDERVRISTGGTSGTKFVFERIAGAEAAGAARRAWRKVLEAKSITARALAGALIAAAALVVAVPALPSLALGLPLALGGAAVLKSTGGIVVNKPQGAAA